VEIYLARLKNTLVPFEELEEMSGEGVV